MIPEDNTPQATSSTAPAPSRNPRPFDWTLAAVLLASLAAVAAVGWFYLSRLETAARAEAEVNLAAVAGLKVQQIVQWRRERLQDATYVRRTPYAARRGLNVLAHPGDGNTERNLKSWLDTILAGGDYEQALLLDTNLNISLAYPGQPPTQVSDPIREAAERAILTRQVTEADLHRGIQDNKLHMALVVPLVVRREGMNDNVPAAGVPESPEDHAAAVLVLQLDPKAFLFPLIQGWPTPSRTAETLLVRREGDEVVYLNELRQRKGPALSLRSPVAAKDLPAAMAVRGRLGSVTGTDYSGVPVLASLRAVPGTSWLMEAKIDQEEVFAGFRRQARLVWITMGLLTLAAALGVAWLGRRRDVQLLQRQLQSEQERRALAERVEVLMHNANDVILLRDAQWRMIDVNARAVESYGYSREELIGRLASEFRAPQAREDFEDHARRMASDGCAITESVHQRKDGTTFPVEISDRAVRIGGVLCGVAFIRDITERKSREREIERLNRLHATLSQVKEAIVRQRTREELLPAVCQAIVQSGGFKLAWIGQHDPQTQVITALAWAGEPQALVHGKRHTAEDGLGSCLSGKAVREGRPAVANVVQGVPELQQWHARMSEAGVRSAAVFPLRLRGEIWGVLGICAAEAGIFQDREVSMLVEAAGDVTFGLEVLDGEQERKRAENALRESEEKYRRLIETTHEGIFVIQEGTIRFANSSASRMIGVGEGELIGRSILELVPAEDRAGVYEDMGKLLQGMIAEVRKEYRALRPDGMIRWMAISAVRITWEGEPATLNLASDVTERKQAEARLRAFSALGERLSAVRTSKEAAHVIVDVADELLGSDLCFFDLYSAAEDRVSYVLNLDIINGQRTECEPEESERPPSPLARRVIEEGGQLILKERLDLMQDGAQPFGDTRRPSAAILYVPVRHGKEVIGLLSIQSYTPGAYNQESLQTLQALADHCGGALARMKAEQALLSSEGRFRTVWENSVDGMRLTDRAGRTVAVNDAYCKLVNLPREKLEGQPFSVAYLKQGPGEGMEVYRERFEAGTIIPHLSRRVRLWNNEELEVELSSSFVEIASQGKLVFCILRDTTAQKALEVQLRHSQKMEGIGQLAGGVAHDFNNLLAIIRGNAELLLMNRNGLSAEACESLSHVAAAAERGAALTRQLLIFSRKQVMRTQPVALNELIGNLTKMLGRVIREDVVLKCAYGEQLPQVESDPGMLEQVILNLVVNARDAIPQGGEIHITTERVTLAAADMQHRPEARAGEFVGLSVQDTGVGIAPEVLPRIFEPFFTTKGVGKGTGLGLATVYGIIKQHRGWVEVSTRVGGGSTFQVFLPALAQAPQAKPAAPVQALAPGKGETILLVEDDYSVRTITRRMLETFQYKVHEAASAREAMERWDRYSQEIALLLTDMVMPEGITGRDLAEKLRAQRPNLKIIFMSGYSAEVVGKTDEFLRHTHTAFLNKPCPADTLVRTVRQCLDGA